mmetsp:Transcript_24607/g.51725  ORF Transcript_24607/g.51725 Transcript_24607/m.51725 type:complete len:123 (+) Transcript_24607:361-729(+)
MSSAGSIVHVTIREMARRTRKAAATYQVQQFWGGGETRRSSSASEFWFSGLLDTVDCSWVRLSERGEESAIFYFLFFIRISVIYVASKNGSSIGLREWKNNCSIFWSVCESRLSLYQRVDPG